MSESLPDRFKRLRNYAEAAAADGLPRGAAFKVERLRHLMDEVKWLQDVDAEEDTVTSVLDEAARLAAEIQRGLG